MSKQTSMDWVYDQYHTQKFGFSHRMYLDGKDKNKAELIRAWIEGAKSMMEPPTTMSWALESYKTMDEFLEAKAEEYYNTHYNIEADDKTT